MANNIELIKLYLTQGMDKVYKQAAKTSVLDGSLNDEKNKGVNANEICIPKISMDGLGEYSRNGGYTNGDAEYTFETVKCNFDRGRMFTIDSMDNLETAGNLFAELAGEFIRTKVVPEIDAFRFATYAAVSGADITAGSYADGEAVRAAIAAKYDAMIDAEVDPEGLVLFITPVLNGLLRDMDTTKSKELLARFASIQVVPQSRFYTAITQYDGSTTGQTAGGYVKATSGHNLNFMIIDPKAVIQFEKHVAPKIVTPEQNQDADAYKFGYRNVGIADAYENKAAGIAGEFAE